MSYNTSGPTGGPFTEGEGFNPGFDPEDNIPWDCDRNLPFDNDTDGEDNADKD